MSNWKSITFKDLKTLNGSQGVYVILHHTTAVAIGYHKSLMSKLAGHLGTLAKVSRTDTGSRRMASGLAGTTQIDYYRNYDADPTDCLIKFKTDADERTAERLIARLDPAWNRRPKRARSNRQARKEGKAPVTTRQVPAEVLEYAESMAEIGRTNQAIADRLHEKGYRSWTGRKWTAANVKLFLERESTPAIYDNVEKVTDASGRVLHYEGSRRRYKSKTMAERFNLPLAIKPKVIEDTTGLEQVLRTS